MEETTQMNTDELSCHSEEPAGDEESKKGTDSSPAAQNDRGSNEPGHNKTTTAAGGQHDTGGTPAQEDMTPKAQRQYEIWRAQAQEAKTFYPGLDMSRELRNPRFAHLLKCGVDVRTAFEVVHRDQILPAAMGAAARAVEKKLTAAMAEARPAESAMHSKSAAVVKTDVAAMSKADRADIIRRVQRGEVIRF